MAFGEEVRRERNAQGRTITECADTAYKLGYQASQSRWTRLEQMGAGSQPRPKTVDMVSDTLKVAKEKVMEWAYPSGKPEDSPYDPRLVRLGRRIAAARAQLGLTQMDFSDAIGVPRATLSTWEQGAAEMGVISMKKIANALRVSMDSLLDETDRDDKSLYDALPCTSGDMRLLDKRLTSIEESLGALLSGR